MSARLFAWPRGRTPLELYHRLHAAHAPIPPAVRFAAAMELHARECEADTRAIASHATTDLLSRLAERASEYRERAAARLAA